MCQRQARAGCGRPSSGGMGRPNTPGARAACRGYPTPDHPFFSALGFRVFYPPPPIKGVSASLLPFGSGSNFGSGASSPPNPLSGGEVHLRGAPPGPARICSEPAMAFTVRGPTFWGIQCVSSCRSPHSRATRARTGSRHGSSLKIVAP